MLAVILTGGKSSRMGRDKALLPYGDSSMAEVLAERYASALGNAAFSVDRIGHFPAFGFPELEDAEPGRGPCNAVISAFRFSKEEKVFFTATDMPYGDPLLAQFLAKECEGYDACVIRRADGRRETMFAVYGRACAEAAAVELREGRGSLRGMLARVRVRELPEEELSGWDLERILWNVNTPEEYRKLMKDE